MSVVDVTTPVVFVHASALGRTGTELPPDMNADGELLDRIERIRGAVCERLGLVDDPAESSTESPNYPKFAFAAPPTDYQTTNGDTVSADEIDLVARVSSMPVMHPVYAVTSASCTAAAVNLPGTIPHEVATGADDAVTIGHPQGTMTVGADVDEHGPAVEAVSVGRTQRRLMEGAAFY